MKPFLFSLLGAVLLLPVSARLLDGADRSDDPEFIRNAALQIDRFVAGWYRNQDLKVPDVTDDATFLRRAFLVAIGRIPTAEEARSFLEIEDEDKRRQLIDYLLSSEGYSSHMANWAFNLLRVTDDKPGFRGTYEPYRAWVRRAIDNNMPWNELTRELINAEGNPWKPETASVGYYLRDRGMPLDNLANTSRVFLGSRIECAQCHDDPFGTTERFEFYELAAFTNGMGEADRRPMRPLWDEVREGDNRGTLRHDVAELIWDRVYGMSLAGGGTGRIHLPDDYQYNDARPGELLGARTPFGDIERMSDREDHEDGREELAEWITTESDNRFPSVIANRMWERVMGRGVYEPVDEYVEAEDTHLPALMEHLVRLMKDLDYDLKAFQNVLLNTKTFQFVPNPDPSKVDTGDDFHGRQLARLSAEQIWDSLITLSSGNPDGRAKRGYDPSIRVRGEPVLVGEMDMVELTEEVLAIESQEEFERFFADFFEKVKKDLDGEGSGSSGDMMMSSMGADAKHYGRNAQVRASELPSPAPRDHLLYLFGQSDREVVEASSSEPNVGQVLALMNGFVQEQLVNNPDAHVYKSLEGASSYEEKIRRLYVAILNRPPSDEEMDWMLDEVKLSGPDAFPNILAALVMSSEFLFLQ